MTKKAAILGLGARGSFWGQSFAQAGWTVSGFDPDDTVGFQAGIPESRREQTISGTVHGANWVVCCVPDRLELMQKVIQRAQAEAPKDAVVAVATRAFDAETVQGCATRPEQIIVVEEDGMGGFAASVTRRNSQPLKTSAVETLAEMAAITSLHPEEPKEHNDQSKSA